jgi:hypothetical protein
MPNKIDTMLKSILFEYESATAKTDVLKNKGIVSSHNI